MTFEGRSDLHDEGPELVIADGGQQGRRHGIEHSLMKGDFVREEGISREWILGHVRAGQAEVTREIEAAGFTFVRQEPTPFLRENYMLRFRK